MGLSIREQLEAAREAKEAAARKAAAVPVPAPVVVKKSEPEIHAEQTLAKMTEPPKKPGGMLANLMAKPKPAVTPSAAAVKPTLAVLPVSAPAPVIVKPEPPKPAAILPVTPPDPGITDEVLLEVKKNIKFVSEHIGDKELVQQVTRKILEQIRKNPHFRSALMPTEINMIVAAIRRSFSVAAMKKIEGKEKKKKRSDAVDAIDQAMKDYEDMEFS